MTTTHRARTAAAPATRPPRLRRTPTQTLTGLAAALALVGGVIGVPLTLSVVAPIGVPGSWPVWSEIVHVVMRPDDGRLAVAAIHLVAWVAWAAFTWAVVIETHAGLRNTTAREVHVLGVLQSAAATLVGAVLLTLASPVPTPTAVAGPDTVAMQVMPDAGKQGAANLTQPAGAWRSPAAARTPRSEAHLPVITVQDGDSLWFIAERHLGAGARYPEILALNIGRPQPDGLTLTDAHDIEPGWQLTLPADAVNLPTPPASSTALPGVVPSSVVVVPGDTLWGLAETHLQDGERYPEIATLNLGVTQPDGDALADPDLIRPGWVLAMPAPPTVTQPDAPMTAPDAAAAVPDAVDGTVVEAAPPADGDADALTPDAHQRGEWQGAISQPDAWERMPDAAITPPDAGQPTTIAPDATTVKPDAGPTSGEEPDTAEADDPAAPAGLVLGLTTLTAAGLIGELARRRLLQRRVRRVGQRIAMPEPASPADDAERAWRATATPLSLGQLRTALDTLAISCFTSERDLPRVGAIAIGSDRVTLRLVEDDPNPVAPFTGAGPVAWVAPTGALARLKPVDRSKVPEPYPALVAAGHTANATVLINLEAAGTLRVVGEPDATAGLLRALLAELATSELSGRIGLTAGDEFADLAAACAPSRLQAPSAPGPTMQLADRLDRAGRSLQRDGLDDTLQARSDRTCPDLWLPVIFVDDVPDPAPCAPWCGTVLITTREGPGGWTLTVDRDGNSHLDALDLRLTVARLDPAGLRLVTELLATASPPAPDQSLPSATATPADQGARAALAALPIPRPPASEPGEPDGPTGLRVNVLGTVEIENVPTEQRLTPRQTELLVYLALRGQTTGPAMDEDLWPGSRTDGVARWGLAYRTRRIVLDRNLPRTEKGDALRLGPGVTCDWDDFRRLATSGLTAEAAGVANLQRALDLVRGRPLTGVPPSAYAWADRDTDTMISTVADVAFSLARHLLDTGDSRGALSAAVTGLAADPCSEDLREIAVSAAVAHGDIDEARRIQDKHAALLAELDDEYV